MICFMTCASSLLVSLLDEVLLDEVLLDEALVEPVEVDEPLELDWS